MTTLQDAQQQALQTARSLAAQGVPIFLGRPDDSKAGFAFPRGWESTTADPSVLDAWEPGMAVCAVMGVVCDALDIDPRHGGDRTAEGLQAAGLWPRSYGRASTPSGGTHELIARTHAGKGSKDGVDLQAGDDQGQGRGFIFIAPTERPSKVTGEILAYRWEVEPDVSDTEGDDTGAELVPLFAKAEKAREAYQMTGQVAGAAEVAERAQALAQRLREAPIGEGNNTAASVATYLGNYVAAGQISKADAVGILFEAISGWEFSHRKDREAMQDTIIRQVEFGMKTERPWEAKKTVDFTEDVVVDIPTSDEADPVAQMLARLMGRDEITNMVEPDPLIAGYLDKGMVARLSGASNSGKSFIALDMAGCVAAGIPWHGRASTKGKVVYLVAEGVAGIRRRVEAWEFHYGRKMDDVLFYPGAIQVMEAEWSIFMEVCKRVGASLIVLDTQARVTSGIEENSNTDMGRVVKRIDALKDHTGATVMLIHHTGHEGGRSRGASAVYGALDHEFLVDKSAEGVVRMKTSKQKDREFAEDKRFRMTKVGPEPDVYEEDRRSIVLTDWVRDESDDEARAVKFTQSQGRLMAVLEALGQGPKSKAETLFMDKSFGEPGPSSRGSFHAAWKALEARGFIGQVEVRRGVEHVFLVSEDQRFALAAQARADREDD